MEQLKWFEKWAVMCFCAAAYVVLYNWQGWKEADGTIWAAWVQAIGSIAAILAAFAVANSQHRSARSLEKSKRAMDEIRRFETSKVMLMRVCVTVEAMTGVLRRVGFNKTPASIGELLDESAAALRSIPPFDLPHPALVVLFATIPRDLESLKDSLVTASRYPVLTEPETAKIEAEIASVVESTKSGSAFCFSEEEARRSHI